MRSATLRAPLQVAMITMFQLLMVSHEVNHAMAMKANSLRGILRFALEKGAKGSECASISEAIHAVSTGFKPENVVYDSPCKTKVVTKLQRNCFIITEKTF